MKRDVAAITPSTVALMYLRAAQVIHVLPISRRCLSNWQARRLIKFYKVSRTVLFKRTDIEAALEKFAVMPIGTPRQRRAVETSAPVAPRRRPAGRIEPADAGQLKPEATR